MRTKAVGFVIAAVLAGVACGQQPEQSVDRVFYLTQAGTAREFQEIATVIRSVADIREVSTDSEKKTITVRGTAGQMALAEWLVNALDSPNPTSGEYRVTAGGDDVVRVFYLTHAGSPQIMQEAVTTIRAIADVQRAFIYNARKAVALRGTAGQMALAEWLLNELDQPAPGQPNPAPQEFRPAGGSDLVRVFYLTHTETPQDLQKVAVAVRSTTNIRRLFINNAPRALAVRGTVEQVAAAARLVQELDNAK